jgi:hypothetical protein
MPTVHALREALAEPPETPFPPPDPQQLIRLARRRRRLRRTGLGAGLGSAAVLLAALGPAAVTQLTNRQHGRPATVSLETLANQGTDAPRDVAPRATQNSVPHTAAVTDTPSPTAASTTSTPTSTASSSPPLLPARRLPDTQVTTPTLTPRNPSGGSGGGMPDGGGSEIGMGVPVSPTGRYQFDLICSGAWQNRAVEVSFETMSAPHTRLPADRPAGRFDCRGDQLTAQVALDSSTTQQLRNSGSMVLMNFAVVRPRDDGSGYVSVGPVLTGMSITFGNVQAEGAS